MRFSQILMLAAAAVSPVFARYRQYTEFVNHCDRPIVFHQSFPDGPTRAVGYDGPQIIIPPNGGREVIKMHQPINSVKQGISNKFRWEGDSHLDGELQLEYTVSHADDSPGVAWDGSLVDGAGAGINGLGPFAGVNVKLTPIGNDDYDRYWDCVPVLCYADEVCHGMYQYDKDDKKTRTCSPKLEALMVDFCAPDDLMYK